MTESATSASKSHPFRLFPSQSGDEQHSEAEKQAKLQGNLGLVAITIAALLYLFGENTQSQESIATKASRIVNESQMLGMLSSGSYNPDIIIVREAIYSGNQPIYQNICVVKELNKTEYPVTCIITNLPAFLSNL